MAEQKKSFVLYTDLINTVEKLIKKDRENKTNLSGELFYHILQYVNDRNPQTDDFIIELAFEPIKCQLKRDLDKWSNSKDEKAKSGRLGNLKRWHSDLYDNVVNEKITLEEAEEIAKHRKTSHSDKCESQNIASVANIAVNEDVSVNVISKCNSNNNSIISETKVSNTQNQNSSSLNSEKEKKETKAQKTIREKREFIEALEMNGASKEYAEEYCNYRIDKKLSVSKIVLNKFLKESQGLNINDVIETCIIKGWQGFEKNWYENAKKEIQKPKQPEVYKNNPSKWDEMLKKQNQNYIK